MWTKHMQKSQMYRIAIVAALLMGNISFAVWSQQSTGRGAVSEEEQKQFLERLKKIKRRNGRREEAKNLRSLLSIWI
jgi:hypothetical protein